MGVVYEATQEQLERRVAIKLLNRDFAANQEMVNRFVSEAKTAAKLSHDNIVAVYDAGKSSNTFYYVMEYIDGFSLADLQQNRGLLPWKDMAQLMLQATKGLICSWENGIIHRDIKPSNLLVTHDKILKIMDFGIAKTPIFNSISVTQTGTVMGTPLYSSPEQDDNAKEVDLRSDIYSLGATFYHLIAGIPPHQGNNATQIVKEKKNPLIPIRSLVNTPAGFAYIIEKMLAKELGQRYQYGRDLLKDLEELLYGIGDDPSLEYLLKKANSAFNRGEFRKALAYIRLAHSTYQPTTDTLNTEANCLADLKEHQQAIECLDQILKVNQYHTAAWHNKGRSLRALGRLDEALVCFTHAIKSGGEPAQIWMSWNSLGNCYRDLGRLTESASAYSHSLQLRPDPQTLKSLNEVLEQIKKQPPTI